MVIAGLNEKRPGSSDYALCEITPGGSLVEPLYFASGPGSTLGLGFLENRLNSNNSKKKGAEISDTVYQKELYCSLADAKTLVKETLDVVTRNDGGAGGAIKICIITEDNGAEFT